jgi:hypothetical protein
MSRIGKSIEQESRWKEKMGGFVLGDKKYFGRGHGCTVL